MTDLFTMAGCPPTVLPASVLCRHGRMQHSIRHSGLASSFLAEPLPLRIYGSRQARSDLWQLRRTSCYLDDAGVSSDAKKISNRKQSRAGAGGSKSTVTDSELSTSGTLYPPLASHKKAHLQVSSLHTIYYEVFGNPKGRPVVFLHGGPGAGCSDRHARFFDPQHYRIVLFDQRGCGKSTPRGCLEENTTWDLVADIEQLREHLGVTKWMVMGGSWGVTLALAYAQSHPDSVAALILRGVCLLRPQEIDWFYKQGANALYPFAWEELLSLLEPSERKNVLYAYYKRLTGTDSSTQQRAAQAWLKWEMGLSFFSTSPYLIEWNGHTYQTLRSPLAVAVEASEISSNKNGGTQGKPTGPPPTPTPTTSPLPSPSSTAPSLSASSSSRPSSSTVSFSTPKSVSSTTQSKSGASHMSSQLAQARLESHYFMNGGFFEENQLIQGITKIRHIPGIIVQGRFDFVCPLTNAYDLHRAWPEAHLRIVPNAGHSMYDQGISYELVRATDVFKRLEY